VEFNNKIFLVISLLLLSVVSLSQSYDTLNIKEEFDAYNDFLVEKHKVCVIDPNDDAFIFGDGMSKVLEAYLNMYELTNDKAYLYKFIMNSLCIVENRNDINSNAIASTPKWTEGSSSTYADGYIIAALSRFVFCINVLYPDLKDEELYSFPEIMPDNYLDSSCNCNFSGIYFKTFGDYSVWLSEIVDETISYFIDNELWSEEFGMIQPGSTLEINMQAGFARAFLFMGLANKRDDYFNKAKRLAELYKSKVEFNDKCEKRKYSNQVLVLDTVKNSYWWYHMGWKVNYRNCKMRLNQMPDYNYYTFYVEDVNHGAMVTLFPLDYYKYASDTIFTEEDMVRFRNTFTKNIYNGKKYNTGLDGTNGKTYIERAYDSITIEEILRYFSLPYSCWAEFDGVDETADSPDVYDLTMKDYINYFTDLKRLPAYYSGQKCLGHSMLVSQQWEKDSTDLTLYNRNLVYNQDFNAKRNLVIAPQINNKIRKSDKTPFADPKTFVDEGELTRFVIEPGVEVHLSAGKSVHLKQGFRAKSGSKLKINLID